MRFLPILLSLSTAVPSAAQQPSADFARVYELHEVEVLPRPQNAADFTAALRAGYPVHLRESGVGGTVQVAFVVRPDGQPADIRVLTTPDSAFDVPSVQAVSLLRFSPAQLGGRPVPVRVEQPITWRPEVRQDFLGQGVRAGTPVPAGEAPAGDSVNGYEMRDVEELPRAVNTGEFSRELARAYPPALRAEGVQGIVELRFRVEPGGTTSGHTITHSTNSAFDEPTLQAIPVLRFRPARLKGRPVRVWVQQPIHWVLERPSRSPAAGDSVNGYELSQVEVLPRPLNSQMLGRELARWYPAPLRDAGTEGTVHVRFRVEPDGTTSNYSVTRSTNSMFDGATLRAIRVLRFRPAQVGGRSVRAWVELPIQWTVKGAPGSSGLDRYERDRPSFYHPPADPCRVERC
jgi:TonB family protein